MPYVELVNVRDGRPAIGEPMAFIDRVLFGLGRSKGASCSIGGMWRQKHSVLRCPTNVFGPIRKCGFGRQISPDLAFYSDEQMLGRSLSVVLNYKLYRRECSLKWRVGWSKRVKVLDINVGALRDAQAIVSNFRLSVNCTPLQEREYRIDESRSEQSDLYQYRWRDSNVLGRGPFVLQQLRAAAPQR